MNLNSVDSLSICLCDESNFGSLENSSTEFREEFEEEPKYNNKFIFLQRFQISDLPLEKKTS